MKWPRILETIAIFVAMLSLWPLIIARWRGGGTAHVHVGWKVFMYVMLATMVLVFVRRCIRYARAVKRQRAELQKRRQP